MVENQLLHSMHFSRSSCVSPEVRLLLECGVIPGFYPAFRAGWWLLSAWIILVCVYSVGTTFRKQYSGSGASLLTSWYFLKSQELLRTNTATFCCFCADGHANPKGKGPKPSLWRQLWISEVSPTLSTSRLQILCLSSSRLSGVWKLNSDIWPSFLMKTENCILSLSLPEEQPVPNARRWRWKQGFAGRGVPWQAEVSGSAEPSRTGPSGWKLCCLLHGHCNLRRAQVRGGSEPFVLLRRGYLWLGKSPIVCTRVFCFLLKEKKKKKKKGGGTFRMPKACLNISPKYFINAHCKWQYKFSAMENCYLVWN